MLDKKVLGTLCPTRCRKQGLLGLEIEIEGVNLKRVDSPVWRTDVDHSLKAAEAYEYVLREPLDRDPLEGALEELNNALKDSTFGSSYRAGTHVHINCQDLTLKQLATFLTLLWSFEPLIVRDCGASRVGNLFCLRTVDAEAYIPHMIQSVTCGEVPFTYMATDLVKYSAVNTGSLKRYGTIELRCMRSTTDPEVLLPWIDKLIALKEYSLTLRDPVEVVERFSLMGEAAYIAAALGSPQRVLKKDREAMWESVRLAQDFAYCRDWD